MDKVLTKNNFKTVVKIDKNLKNQEKTLIISQIEKFHEQYQQRYKKLKQSYDIVTKQNRQYSSRLIQYESKYQQYQLMIGTMKKNTENLTQKVEELMKYKAQTKIKFSEQLGLKNQQIEILKNKIETNKQVKKKKKNEQNSQEQKTLTQVINCQSTRLHHKITIYQDQNESLQLQIINLSRQNEILKRKIKHYQTDKLYQEQRLKNATLTLDLDIMMKNQQIQRLKNQLKIYSCKFNQFLEGQYAPNTDRISICQQESAIQSNKNKNIRLKVQNYENKQNKQNDNNEKTQRKVEMTTVHTHQRHYSANLQTNNNNHPVLDMKVKCIKVDKNRRKIV